MGGFYFSLCSLDDLVRLCRAIPAREDGNRRGAWASTLRGGSGCTGNSGDAEASYAGLAASAHRSHRPGHCHVRPGIDQHVPGDCRRRSLWSSIPARRFRPQLPPLDFRISRRAGAIAAIFLSGAALASADHPQNTPGHCSGRECVLSERGIGVWRGPCGLAAARTCGRIARLGDASHRS